MIKYEIIEWVKKMKNRVIVWRITQQCNLLCRFCSYSREVERRRDEADGQEIERVSEVLGDYKQLTGDHILVSWIGGEPFLRKDIFELSKNLNSRGIEISATTNGIPLDKNMLSDIDQYFSEIVFSLDGFEEHSDTVRQFDGYFQTVTQKIRLLDQMRNASKSGLKIKVNTILMRRNISQFEKFCEYLAELGVDEVTFNRLGGYDRPEFFDDNRLLYSQSKKLADELPEIKKRLADKGLIIHGSKKYMERFLSAARDIKNPIEECYPGQWFWFINENGYISPCSYTTYEYEFPISDIRSVEDIPKVEQYFRDLRKNSRSDWCDNCFCTQVYDKFE